MIVDDGQGAGRGSRWMPLPPASAQLALWVLRRPLRIRAQRERYVNHSEPFGRLEVVAGAVESIQVPRPQLFDRFAPAAGEGDERLGPPRRSQAGSGPPGSHRSGRETRRQRAVQCRQLALRQRIAAPAAWSPREPPPRVATQPRRYPGLPGCGCPEWTRTRQQGCQHRPMLPEPAPACWNTSDSSKARRVTSASAGPRKDLRDACDSATSRVAGAVLLHFAFRDRRPNATRPHADGP